MAGDMESNNSSVERGAGKNKRKWTEDEDEKLVEALMKTLKKDFGVVYDICYGANSSGFGWNAEDNVLTAPRDVWVQYLKLINYHIKILILRLSSFQNAIVYSSIKGFALNSNAQLYRFRLLMLSTSFEVTASLET